MGYQAHHSPEAFLPATSWGRSGAPRSPPRASQVSPPFSQETETQRRRPLAVETQLVLSPKFLPLTPQLHCPPRGLGAPLQGFFWGPIALPAQVSWGVPPGPGDLRRPGTLVGMWLGLPTGSLTPSTLAAPGPARESGRQCPSTSWHPSPAPGRRHPQEAQATLVSGPSQEPTHNSPDFCLKTPGGAETRLQAGARSPSGGGGGGALDRAAGEEVEGGPAGGGPPPRCTSALSERQDVALEGCGFLTGAGGHLRPPREGSHRG